MATSIVTFLAKIFSRLSSVCLFAAMLLIGADVFMRYIFNAPIAGTLELSTFAPVIATYCSFAYTAVHQRHIRTTFVLDRVPSRIKLVLEIFSLLMMFSFVGVLVWQTSLEAFKSFGIREISQGLIQVPKYPVKILIPIALFVGWIYYLLEIIYLFTYRGTNRDGTAEE
jgi:TRAP-type C4-dicarboxylate transport system permease small subunit